MVGTKVFEQKFIRNFAVIYAWHRAFIGPEGSWPSSPCQVQFPAQRHAKYLIIWHGPNHGPLHQLYAQPTQLGNQRCVAAATPPYIFQEVFAVSLALDHCAKLRAVLGEEAGSAWRAEARGQWEATALMYGRHYTEGAAVWASYRAFLKEAEAGVCSEAATGPKA